MNEEQVSLSTLASGAAVERFDHELQRVIDNIADYNTDPKAVREVSLKVKIRPNDDRSFSVVEIIATSKIAPIKPETTSLYLNGSHATEFNPRQEKIHFERKEV